MTDSHDILTR